MIPCEIEIRTASPYDFELIREVSFRAFGQSQESHIVEALRANGAIELCLVAILNGRLVGYVVYSPATVGQYLTGAALGPMAVLPDYQRRGVGSKLVSTGTRRLKTTGCPFIVVVGHEDYYPRFGFVPASRYGIQCEWSVPDEVFMILILDDTRMAGVSGLTKFRQEFSTVT